MVNKKAPARTDHALICMLRIVYDAPVLCIPDR